MSNWICPGSNPSNSRRVHAIVRHKPTTIHRDYLSSRYTRVTILTQKSNAANTSNKSSSHYIATHKLRTRKNTAYVNSTVGAVDLLFIERDITLRKRISLPSDDVIKDAKVHRVWSPGENRGCSPHRGFSFSFFARSPPLISNNRS